MKNINIGVANLVVSNLLKESYLNNTSINEVKNTTSELVNIVKNSPILQLEFKVFNSIENKQIDDDALAPRYIDNNIKLFEVYTEKELKKEHKKLEPFINENNVYDDNRINLYNAIGTLIEESLKPSNVIDVDQIHEAFSIVLEHIKKPKTNNKADTLTNINEEVIELAINKFNEKYEKMSLDEVNLFKKLVNADDNEKEKIFKEYKDENSNILQSLLNENENEKISKSLDKLNDMNYNPEQADNDIIKLFELKQGLQ